MSQVQFKIKKGDTRPRLRANLKDSEGPIVLTGSTVRFHMKNKQTGATKVDGVASLYDALTGTVEYEWQTADTDTSGFYDGEFEVTFLDGGVMTFPNNSYITIQIMDELL